MKLPLRLHFALSLVLAVATATIARSVIEEKWITVFASSLLVAGAVATWRARTWGAGLTLLAAAAYPVAHLLGMAPSWFWGVGVVAALTFLMPGKPMARCARPAGCLFAAL